MARNLTNRAIFPRRAINFACKEHQKLLVPDRSNGFAPWFLVIWLSMGRGRYIFFVVYPLEFAYTAKPRRGAKKQFNGLPDVVKQSGRRRGSNRYQAILCRMYSGIQGGLLWLLRRGQSLLQR